MQKRSISLTCKVGVAKVEKNDSYIATVVGVDDPGPNVYGVLPSQPAAGGDAAIVVRRNCDGEVRLYQGLAAGRHHSLDR